MLIMILKKPEKISNRLSSKNHAGHPWKIASYSGDIAGIAINMSAEATGFEN
ncbi:hypothetical protein METP3_02557 [Methanosarcinales archaeon]|nr:hypothetical protein METP3_02557 [Methanosarcinales archaeon]